MKLFNTTVIHPSWRALVNRALAAMEQDYLQQLQQTANWLPGADNIFNAFSLPLPQTQYILFGESPYPRAQSANGYAFWDAAVNDLWSVTGLAKAVNRATSLRNFIKMLLVSDHYLNADDTSQAAIAELDKSAFIQTIGQLFHGLQQHGVLLLNTSLVLSEKSVRYDAKHWHAFIQQLLAELSQRKPDVHFILFGQVAKLIEPLARQHGFNFTSAEHPYNISFITNPSMHTLFKPFDLLTR